MRALDWTVTVRPFRVLRHLVLAVVAVALVVFPIQRVGTGSDRAPRTLAQLAHQNALDVVERTIATKIPYLDSDRRVQLTRVVLEESMACGLDPLFALAVAEVESRGNHEAVSPTGALGLFQLIPQTWKAEVARRGLGHLERFNVVHNARVGIGYLCHLHRTFRHPDSLLLAYNQGPGGALAILKQEAPPSDEAAAYSARVWKSYRTLLARNHLDARRARQLWKQPRETVYRPPIVVAGVTR